LRRVVSADFREVGWRRDLDEVLVVQSQDLLGNALNSGVDEVQSVFARVYLLDDAIVYIDKCFFGTLDADKNAIKHFSLVHFVRGQLDFGFIKTAMLVSNALPVLNSFVDHNK